MRLTIDNLDGAGEQDYTSLLDAEAPPKIVRKLNQPPELEARLVCRIGDIEAGARSKVRLYRDSGSLWFSGYLLDPPQESFAGSAMGAPVFRVLLTGTGEMAALDREVLSWRAGMNGYTAGEVISAITEEADSTFLTSGMQDIAQAGTVSVETGERWSSVAGKVAEHARSVLAAESRAVTLESVGAVTRTLSDQDAGFLPAALNLSGIGPVANEITVFGGTEATSHVRDCYTAFGTSRSFYLSETVYHQNSEVQVEDDFNATVLDSAKWVSDVATPLTFTSSGVACNGEVALRYRDRVELGGLITLEQTGILYGSGEGIVGGLFDGGFDASSCIAGVQLSSGQIQPVIDGVVGAAVATVDPNMLYEFRTILYHPEPVRSPQVYASSINNGGNARTAQVGSGTSYVLLTMRTIDPADASTTSSSQVVIYDGALPQLPPFADYLPMWGVNLTCTLGHARAAKQGPFWVRTSVSGQPFRSRVIGDTAAGAECYLAFGTLYFTAASAPVFNEQIEIAYRSPGVSCARVTDSQNAALLANNEDNGRRAAVLHVTSPPPRTSLDCEQAANALLDDLTQTGCRGGYKAWLETLPDGAVDVHPGEEWNIAASAWNLNCTVVVQEVEIAFEAIADAHAIFNVRFANDAAQPIAIRFQRGARSGLEARVSSELGDDLSTRPADLPDLHFTQWEASTLVLDAGVTPVAGGGIEVRVEGDWGWGTELNQNLVGRYTTQSFSLPYTAVRQAFYIRQFDASSPPRYSTYSTVLNLVV